MDRERNFSPLLENPDPDYSEKHPRSANVGYGIPRHIVRLSVRRLCFLITAVVLAPTLLTFSYFKRRPIGDALVFGEDQVDVYLNGTDLRLVATSKAEPSLESATTIDVAETTANAKSDDILADWIDVPEPGASEEPVSEPEPEPTAQPVEEPKKFEEPFVPPPPIRPDTATPDEGAPPPDGPAEPAPPVEDTIPPPPPAEPVPPVEPAPPVDPNAVPPPPPPPPPPADQLPDGAPPPPPPPPTMDPIPAGDHRLIMVIPQDAPTPEICKVMFSAMANGYPSPVILNWGNSRQRLESGLDTSHLFKIIKGVNYLDKMMDESANDADRVYEHDLVFIMDALDIWWQLPPDLLIKRYHEAIKASNERLAKEWSGPGPVPYKNTLLGGAQKRCWPTPDYGIELHCDMLPQSPVRADLFGERTDEPGLHHAGRVKHFNGGTLMGPAGDLRRFWRRSLDRISRVQSHHPRIRSDQGIQGEVWGEQEMFRDWLRRQPNRNDPDFINDPMMRTMLENYEYGFSVDYFEAVAINTNFKELDADFMIINNQTAIDIRSKELGIDPVRLRGVPEDVKATKHPLTRVLPENEVGDWGDLPLFADYYSEVVPVIVHHNAYENGLKERRKWWWDRTWYFPHLRRLVHAYLEKPLELPILGQFPVGDGLATYRALPSELTKRKPRRFEPEMAVPGLPEMEYADMCGDRPDNEQWFDQVFRDGKGPL
ncbi:hypothetical protein B0T10DRAFT_56984 [Thelonectria olida]|uniref:Uncharacterized protein n=1 Tax=Thelonectria olida TaxID=1576542 RepID=A0A9P9APT8_9HYPO|nr:hypothetical protein B0T10DRAFT_56984 [Thelonectria olida]